MPDGSCPHPPPHLVLDVPMLLAKEQQLWGTLSRAREEFLAAVTAQLDRELGPFGLAAAQAHRCVLEDYSDVLQQIHRELWDER